ncbi:uncharacterized protein LOC121749830 [Salvia splendens]|uniref:uncharacterized protein LOC121749830 n=1 Tax=Salvia splendens TaxID=180675 RepID=UPI001C255EF5|nr:uncharacterized protein LOC121749830 [Salvia splendens]
MPPIVTSDSSSPKASPRFRTRGTRRSSTRRRSLSSARTTQSATFSACNCTEMRTFCLPDTRIQTTSQSSPMQAYNQAINDLDKELDHLKNAFEVELARHNASQQREF